MVPKYNIGDTVWWAHWDTVADWVTCPECGGSGQITCELYDGTRLSVECAGCTRGFEGPKGALQVWKRTAVARLTMVDRVEVAPDKIEYGVTGSYRVDEGSLFDNEADARTKARGLAAELDQQDRDKIARKEKDTRSWSWNVHYHRRQIRDAEKSIAYHTAKLNVAKLKAKEPPQ